MEACYGGTDVMERSCAVARGIDINTAGGRTVSSWWAIFICARWRAGKKRPSSRDLARLGSYYSYTVLYVFYKAKSGIIQYSTCSVCTAMACITYFTVAPKVFIRRGGFP